MKKYLAPIAVVCLLAGCVPEPGQSFYNPPPLYQAPQIDPSVYQQMHTTMGSVLQQQRQNTVTCYRYGNSVTCQ